MCLTSLRPLPLTLALPLALACPPAWAQVDASSHDGEGWTQAQLEQISRRIEKEIEALRGEEFVRPVSVRISSRETFIEHAIERTDDFQDEARQAALESMAKHLGLIPVEMDMMEATLSLLEDQVGGFYDPSADTFYLMETFTGGLAELILSHELTHALDDQLYDLDRALRERIESSDAMLAYSSVVEGSGTNAMQRWMMENAGKLTMSDLTKMGSLGTEGLADAPPYLWKPLMATYTKGDAFLSRGFGLRKKKNEDATMNETVGIAFHTPPRSTEQILHPEKYWDPRKLDEPSVLRHDLSSLPAGWRVLGRDTYGELGLALLTTPRDKRKGLDASNPLAMMGMQYTNKAASGWDGDEALLLEREDGARVMHLATTWDRAKDAQEFRASISEQLDALEEIQRQLASNGQGGWMVLGYEDERQFSVALWSGCSEEDVQALRQGPLRWSEVRTSDSTTE